MSLRARSAIEAIGTGFLLAAVVGSGIMAEQLAGGNVALALLANTVATTATLFALIAVLAPFSGAHLNPVVTLAATVRGETARGEAAAYIAAQIIGAVVGVMAAHLMFDRAAIELSQHTRAGFGQMFGESVATFGLVLLIGLSHGAKSHVVAASVAAYVAGAYWFTSSTCFANPAVTIARALSDSFAGIRPADVPGFLAGQVTGGAVAVLVLGLFRVEHSR